MRKLLCGSVLLLCCLFVQAQGPVNLIDSFKVILSKAKTPADRVDALGDLARMATNSSIAEADKWGRQMTEEAELSRDRKLIVKALLVNGERYGFMAAKREYLEKSIGYYREAVEEARKEKLDTLMASAYIALSGIYLTMPDYEQAARNAQQALSVSTVVDDDSLKATALNANGDVYLARKERLFALRYYLNALRLAENKKLHKVMRTCYSNLSKFYTSIEEFDKGIDYAQKAINELAFLHEGGELYNKVIDLCGMGSLYSRKKSWDMSQFYFEKALVLADSLRYPPMKMPAYNGLLNLYIDSHQPAKALAYFNERTDLQDFANKFGLGYVIDMAYGVIYTDLGRFDTAQRYFEKAAPFYEVSGTPRSRVQFYSAYGELFKRWGNTTKAIAYFDKARALADGLNALEAQKNLANELDSLYATAGDYKQSYFYKGRFVAIKDSMQKLGEEKDLLQVELADEQQRSARVEREREAALERKHTLQYMGITVAIGAAFVLLVLIGFFRVSESVIKVLGFFSFIFLFEFLILIADNKIHHWTHGEPLKVLAIKVLLIAALLPLHHWLEHKVVHYIASRKLHHAGRTGIARILGRKQVNQELG